MNLRLLPILMLIGLWGCSGGETSLDAESDQFSAAELQARRLAAANLYVHTSVKIPNTDYYFFPISASKENKGYRYFYGGVEYEDRTWNVAFYHIETKQIHFLIDDSIVPMIVDYPDDQEFQYLNETEMNWHRASKMRTDKLFFEIRMEDFNGNGKIDRDDPNGLFMSELDGTQLTRISPAGFDLRDWKLLDADKRKVELRCLEDSDQSQSFSQKDKQRLFVVHLDSLQLPPFELFADPLRKKLKEQYIGH